MLPYGKQLKRNVVKLTNTFGYDLIQRLPTFPPDELALIAKVRPYTMTHDVAISGLIHAVRYVLQNRIEGDFVECGVWRGGSVMTMAYTLLALGDKSRNLRLFDTFEGMNAPTEDDIDVAGKRAQELMDGERRDKESKIWAYASLDDVQRNLRLTQYPEERMTFAKGKV